jgi:hypothetical protein
LFVPLPVLDVACSCRCLFGLSSPKGICFCSCRCLLCSCRCSRRCSFGCHPRRGSASVLVLVVAVVVAFIVVSSCRHPERSEGPPPHTAPTFRPKLRSFSAASGKKRLVSTLATHCTTFYRTFSRRIGTFSPKKQAQNPKPHPPKPNSVHNSPQLPTNASNPRKFRNTPANPPKSPTTHHKPQRNHPFLPSKASLKAPAPAPPPDASAGRPYSA